MSRTIRTMVFVLVMLAVVGSAGSAFAAPVAWQRVEVILHADQQPVLLVSGELPADAKLPCEAELAVPAGSPLSWIGEILGGPPAQDPELTYAKSTANGFDVYRFTMTKARTAQVEVAATGMAAFDGKAYNSTLGWTAWQSVPEVQISQRVPVGARITTQSVGASLQTGDAAYSYYTKTVQNVKAGDRVDLTFSYTAPAVTAAATGAGSPAASGTDPAAVAILVVVVLAIIAVVIVAARRRPTARPVSDQDDSDPDEDSTSEGDGPVVPRSGMSWGAKRGLIIVGIIAVVIVAASIAGREAVKPKLAGDTISRTLLPGQPCANITVALNVPDGADPTATAEKLIAALTPMGVVNTVSYNVKTSSLAIGYCESTSSESAIRAALAPTGLVAQAP